MAAGIDKGKGIVIGSFGKRTGAFGLSHCDGRRVGRRSNARSGGGRIGSRYTVVAQRSTLHNASRIGDVAGGGQGSLEIGIACWLRGGGGP